MEKRATIIGIGNCGSQIANHAEITYPELFDCVYINTSEMDLNQVSTPDNPMKFKIGNPEEVEGSGRNRSKTKEYLHDEVYDKIITNEKFSDVVATKDYCFIISSTAGGTGSGASPVMYKILTKMFPAVNFILVFVLPKISGSLMEQGNTLEYLDEVNKVLGSNLTYMAYDNETVADMSPIEGPAKVNSDIVEDIKVIVSGDFGAKYNNIDRQDMINVATNPGRLLVTRITKGLTEKALDATRLDDLLVTAIKQSSQAETDRNNKVDRIALITYLTPTAYELYPDMTHLTDFLGKPFEIPEHHAENIGKDSANYVYMIAGGLGPINDRTEKIIERVNEIKEAMAKDEKMQFILDGSVSYDDIMTRRDRASHLTENTQFSIDDIFSDFTK